jgi:hypothetical protein
MTEEKNALLGFADAYAKNPVLRGLIQLIPYGIGSAFDTALTTALMNWREKRFRIYFDELSKGSKVLTEQLIGEEDFLYAYFSTLKASINQNREQKIRLYARFLCNAVALNKIGTDAFDEFLSILDDLSLRELQILLLLKEIDKSNPPIIQTSSDETESENELQRATRYWNLFEHEVERTLLINPQQLRAMLTRLNRTGLYETFTGSYIGYTGGMGYLTELFYDFDKWLQIRANELSN